MNETKKTGEVKNRFFGKMKKLLKSETANDPAGTVGAILLYVGAGYIFARGELLFGCRPFGIALLGAAADKLWCVWIGCCAAALSDPSLPTLFWLILYSTFFAVRALIVPHVRKNGYTAKRYRAIAEEALLSGLFGLAPGIYGSVSERFSLHALFALIFYTVFCTLLTLLYDGGFAREAASDVRAMIGKAALAFSLVQSCCSLSFFGFSPAVTAAVTVCLLCAKTGRYFENGILGLILGIACGKEMIVTVALIGFISSAFYRYSSRIAPSLGVLCGFAFSFFTGGSSTFLYVLPDLVCGLLIYSPLSFFLTERQRIREDETASAEGETFCEPRKLFSELSDRFEKYSAETRMPTKDDVKAFAERTADRCQNGPGGESLFLEVDDGQKKRSLEKISELLFEVGRIEAPITISGQTEEESERTRKELNHGYAEYLRGLHDRNKAECYAYCLRGIAGILENAEKARAKENESDRESAKRVRKALSGSYASFGKAEVIGCTRKKVILRGFIQSAGRNDPDSLRRQIGASAGMRLGKAKIAEERGRKIVTMEVLPDLEAVVSVQTKRKEGEEFCGDTALTFRVGALFFALICDGMGSGRDAFLVSSVTAETMHAFMQTGATAETAIAFLRDFIYCQQSECTTTLDLLAVDLYTGKGCFTKCGASPSYVLRGTNSYRITSTSLPLGSSREADAETVTVRLKPGDTVIMTSDGAARALTGNLPSKLSSEALVENAPDAKEIASTIIGHKENDAENDDRSVIVIQFNDSGNDLEE